MKIKLFFFTMLLLFIMNITTTNAQVNVNLNIENQNVVGTDFFFDIYLDAPNDLLYLGNADFVLTFNSGNFNNPTITLEGTRPGYCTFVPTDASTQSNIDDCRKQYYDNTAPTIQNGNEIIINVNGPTPGTQSSFDIIVAKIDNQTSTHRLGRFKVSGITNSSGSMGLQWKTSGDGTITNVYTLATVDPWTSREVDNLNAVNPPDAALPVELQSFKATNQKGSSVELEWATATEVNNYGFEIERKVVKAAEENEEAGTWEKVAFVEGSGNSNSKKLYNFVDKNPVGGTTFAYRLKQIDIDGTFNYSDEIEVKVLPTKYDLYQNYPNPFNPTTKIKFSLPENAKVKIAVYDILGRELTTLINKNIEAGYHSINFDAAQFTSGVYLYTIETSKFTKVKKMLLIK